eukprot:TRINITY_DN5176_c0_g1_i1.p1 TRINITY_DN5176_c0_g1~~TRINITY_DN5176_c0_g1_i1.p1  ORF type:complete len:407 (-),score=136.73 TRINITY_DN5176_c0_g1_i1:59-1279(-)
MMNLLMEQSTPESKIADISVKDNNGVTPLYRACYHNKYPIVKYLLGLGVDPHDLDDQGQNLYHKAAVNDNIFLLQILESYEIQDIDLIDSAGITPLLIAAAHNNAHSAHWLIRKGAKIEHISMQHLWTAVHFAAERGNIDVLDVLLLEGAEIDRVDNKGRTPLWYATKNERKRAVRVLLKMQASPTQKDNDGVSPVDLAMKLLQKDDMAKIYTKVRRQILARANFEKSELYGVTEVLLDSWASIRNYWWGTDKKVEEDKQTTEMIVKQRENEIGEIVLLSIRTVAGVGKEFCLCRVPLDDKVQYIKRSFADKYGIPSDVIRLFWVNDLEEEEEEEAAEEEGATDVEKGSSSKNGQKTVLEELKDGKTLLDYWGKGKRLATETPEVFVCHYLTEKIEMTEDIPEDEE